MRETLLISSLLLCVSTTLFSQQPLPLATNLKKAYTKQTRSQDGKPGPMYWQNAASYHINVRFIPESRLVSGVIHVDYQNNSPDTLKEVVFKLYPNLYQKQSLRNVIIDPEDLTDGIEIETIQLNGNKVDKDKRSIRGTNMYLRGVKILPNTSTHFELDFSYTLNKRSFVRTGQVDSGAFVMAYFFPRVAVYDDLDGWNQYPYAGKEEFYNDYCNFKVEIRIPNGYQCWATGELSNPAEVYQQEYIDRIKKSTAGDDIVDIITAGDLVQGNITQPNTENVWKYEAQNVTDFAFAISNHYVWKATSLEVDAISKRRTRIDAVYNPDHPAYLPVIEYARKTVELISYDFPAIPFPYSHQTVFEGLDAMEYPMMINNLPFKGSEAIQFTVHEVFHTLFPFFVANNETKYSFLDEGWATFSEMTLAEEIDTRLAGKYDISDFTGSAGSEQDVPIMTLTPQLYGKARFSNKDLKPALALLYLKETLGDKKFREGIRKYITEWHGKHPSPYDFFACMNAGAGEDLNWFWKNWFFEKLVPDLAISNVVRKSQQYHVEVKNLGGAFVAVHITAYFTDGTTTELAFGSNCWQRGNKGIKVTIPGKKPIAKIIVGKGYDADVNPTDNVWMQ